MRANEFISESYDWDWRDITNQNDPFNRGYKPNIKWPPSEQDIREIETRVLQDPEWLAYYKRFGWDSWNNVPKSQVWYDKHNSQVTFYEVPAITNEWDPKKAEGIIPDRTSVKMDLNGNVVKHTPNDIVLPRAMGLLRHYIKTTFTPQNHKYMTERYYVRFGRWHDDERSQNWLATKEQGKPVFEKGVSAYHAEWDPEDQRWAIADGINEDTIAGTLASLLYNPNKKIFLVQGTELSSDGADGEPLLRNVKLIKSLKVTDVYVPGIYDPREEELGESHEIDEMALPADWDPTVFGHDKTFKSRLAYAKDRATRIGGGSSRVAFIIPDNDRDTVLKVAKNTKGMAQNEAEVEILEDGYIGKLDIVIPLIDYDKKNPQPTWIQTELAEKVSETKLAKIMRSGRYLFYIVSYAEHLIGRSNWSGQRVNEHLKTLSDEDAEIFKEYASSIAEVLSGTTLKAADLERASNWGLYQGRPVIIDLGFTDSVAELY